MDRRNFLTTGLAAGAAAMTQAGCAPEQVGAKSKGHVRGQESAYSRLKAYLDTIVAIDTHDHLRPFEVLQKCVRTRQGEGMNLYGLWQQSYFPWIHSMTPWKEDGTFDQWWAKAKNDFATARTASFYRYQLPAFQDLYGVDFDNISDKQARELDRRIFENYRDEKWTYHVITERANIERMFIDPCWRYGEIKRHYRFQEIVFRVQHLILNGFHPSEFGSDASGQQMVNVYQYAKERGLSVETFDDYIDLAEHMVRDAKRRGARCFKQAVAYYRTLYFENIPKERAARAFGKPRSVLTEQEIRDFEDFMMWKLAEFGAKYDMPFQIHTGPGRIPDTGPMLLANLIEGNPKTKFILFHGGYPWVSETAAVVMRFPRNVWVDSVWLPLISYSSAKRALHEWLDVIPANRIMWGGDCAHAEGTYGATEVTRRWIAEVLTERLQQGLLNEQQARQIGKRILRENALELFPQLKRS